MTDYIQNEIDRLQAQLDRMGARLEAVERDLAALRERQVAVAAEGFVAGMNGERKTYADFEFLMGASTWKPLDAPSPYWNAESRLRRPNRSYRCRHTHAPVTAAQIRAAVEAPLVVLGQGTSQTEVRL